MSLLANVGKLWQSWSVKTAYYPITYLYIEEPHLSQRLWLLFILFFSIHRAVFTLHCWQALARYSICRSPAYLKILYYRTIQTIKIFFYFQNSELELPYSVTTKYHWLVCFTYCRSAVPNTTFFPYKITPKIKI